MTEVMFSPLFGTSIDWDFQIRPVELRPIPAKYYEHRHIIQAIRRPNKPLIIRNGDVPFSAIGCRAYSGPWPPDEKSTKL